MENIFFDVDQQAPQSRTEQAQYLCEVESRTGDIQRAAANDPVTQDVWINSDKIK